MRTVKKRVEGKPICAMCLMEQNKRECSHCGKIKKIYSAKNGDLCASCYQLANRERCVKCKKLKPVNGRDEDNNAICQECNRRRGPCSGCGKIRVLKTITNLCGVCRSNRSKEICSGCNKLMVVSKRLENGSAICYTCYERDRKETDLNYRIRKAVGRRISLAVEKYEVDNKYDVDYDGIISYLGEKPNDGQKYHIDHIFPLSAFDLTNEIEFKIAVCPENHQWLPKEENLIKNAKYDKVEFEKFKKVICIKYNLARNLDV
jgi:hypothetical protein